MENSNSKFSGSWRIVSISVITLLSISLMMNLITYDELSKANNKYNNLIETLDNISYDINLLINYGNGTKVWINNSRIPIGFNLFNVTMKITEGKIEAEYYPQFNSHFIKSINHVGGDNNPEKKNWSWICWYFDKELNEWILSEYSSNMIYPKSGDIFAWNFQDTSNYPDYEEPN